LAGCYLPPSLLSFFCHDSATSENPKSIPPMPRRKKRPPTTTPVYVLGMNAQTGEGEVTELNVVQEPTECQTRFTLLSIDPSRLIRALESQQPENQDPPRSA
jgi:hypothetical protein